MRKLVKRVVFWMPRVLCLLFAVFVTLSAFPICCAGCGFWESIVALLIHLIPTWIILIVLAVAWRWEWIGAILFVALGAWYLTEVWGKFEWTTNLLVVGAPLLTGALFLVNWAHHAELRSST